MQFNIRYTLVVLTLITGLIGCGGGSDSNDDNDQDNLLPQVNAGSDFSLEENSNGQLNGSATDSDGTIVSYQWQQTAGTTVQLADPSNATTSFTAPEVDTDETLTFQLTATDNDGGQSSDSVNVEVLNVNALPIVDAGENFSVNEGDNATLNGSASDTDGTIVSYQWQQISGQEVELENANTASTSFIAPQVSEDTILSFELIVTDNDGAQASDTIEVSILNVNQLPVVDAGEDFKVYENTTATLNGSGSAPDGTIESYQWQQVSGQEVQLLNSNNAIASFDVPQLNESAILTFELVVTDSNGKQATDNVNVEIIHVNKSPVVHIEANSRTAQKNDLVTLTGTATDPNNDIVSYLWQQTSGTEVSLTNINQTSVEFNVSHLNSNELLKFTLTVTDSYGLEDSESIEIFADIEDISPSVFAGDEQLIFEPGTIFLQGEATANSQGDINNYQWTQIAGTPVDIVNPNNKSAQFELQESIMDEVLIFQLTASDNTGKQAKATTNVIVSSNTLFTDLNIPDDALRNCVNNSNNMWSPPTYIHEATHLVCWRDTDSESVNGII